MVIQGFGNVGGMAAKLMSREGFKIICIIEYDGAVYNPNGLDTRALIEHREETGSIRDFPGGENMDQAEAMFLECDVLLPAAHGERDHLRKTPTGCAAGFCAKAPTAPPPRWPMRFWPTRRSS